MTEDDSHDAYRRSLSTTCGVVIEHRARKIFATRQKKNLREPLT